jgi:putative membrane protein
MWGHMDGWGPGWGWFAAGHVLWWVVGVVALIALLRWAIQRGGQGTAAAPDRALDLLRESFARGEIDEAEFEARRRTLGG